MAQSRQLMAERRAIARNQASANLEEYWDEDPRKFQAMYENSYQRTRDRLEKMLREDEEAQKQLLRSIRKVDLLEAVMHRHGFSEEEGKKLKLEQYEYRLNADQLRNLEMFENLVHAKREQENAESNLGWTKTQVFKLKIELNHYDEARKEHEKLLNNPREAWLFHRVQESADPHFR